MSVQFHYTDDMVKIVSLEEGSLVDKLKPAIYSVGFNQFTGFYLEKGKSKFTTPKKLFGSVKRRVKKIRRTFDDRETGTGILLTGDKGAGKTMLAEVLCNDMLKNDIPIIIINERYTGSNFTSFVDSLGTVVLFFDEFGKIYPINQKNTDDGNDSQESLLSLLDGVNRQKRMVILTENREADINHFIKARPGRVYYHFRYRKLDEDIIKEFSKCKKIPDDIIECILDASRTIDEFSFDTLKAIVEEYQRFGGNKDNFEEILEDLNIEYDKDRKIRLKVIRLFSKEEKKDLKVDFTSQYIDKPTNNGYFNIALKRTKKEIEEDDDGHWVGFNGNEVTYTSKEKIIFENDYYILVTEPVDDSRWGFNYHAF